MAPAAPRWTRSMGLDQDPLPSPAASARVSNSHTPVSLAKRIAVDVLAARASPSLLQEMSAATANERDRCESTNDPDESAAKALAVGAMLEVSVDACHHDTLIESGLAAGCADHAATIPTIMILAAQTMALNKHR
ncbi:hypothetical protein F66182_10589 [Fusarium sp. NRRL 66182]|nr:hypothetical protein F66182_10589 [Fusarium sp. NRRL 66182]